MVCHRTLTNTPTHDDKRYNDMNNREIKLSKMQFKLFNNDDQFQLFCDDEGMPDYDDFDEEVEKLYSKYDYVLVTEKNYVYGVKNNKREEISDQAYDGYQIANEIILDL